MTTNKLRVFTVLLGSLLIVAAVKTILACGGYDEPVDGEYSTFAPEIIQQPEKTPFFLSPHSFYSLEGYSIPETTPTLTDRNTSEWVSFFDSRLTNADAAWLLYTSSVADLQTLQKSIADKNIRTDSLNKAVVTLLKKNEQAGAVLDYIILAKQSERYFNPDYSSWDPLVYDSASIQAFIPVFMEHFNKATIPFLKQRYGFQVTRALSVCGRHTECIRFFDEAFNPPATAASMYYRSLGYKARSLYKTQQYSLSNYLYAFLFDNDPCQRYMAYQSFHPQEEADWQGTLQLAKSNAEKESLWALFGLYASPVSATRALYAINPQSSHLPLLLVRSINLAEERLLMNPKTNWTSFFNVDFTDTLKPDDYYYNYYSPGQIDSSSMNELTTLINKVVAENKTNKRAVWQLSGAYLSVLKGDHAAAAVMLAGLRIDATDSLLNGQATIIDGILAVKKLQRIDAAAEKEIFDHLQRINTFTQPALRKENALRYITSRLSMQYAKQQLLLKKELAYPQGAPYFTTAARTQEMIDFMNRKEREPLENYLLSKYPLQVNDLYHIKAVAYMYEYNFNAAINEFEKTSTDSGAWLGVNPFTIHITDCHDCDFAAPKKSNYSKYSFAKKMTELKAKGDTGSDAESRAQNYFLYANGCYNMTWYGNARFVYETKVQNTDYGSVMYGNTTMLKQTNFFKCREAMDYYVKAYALSKSKEFKAKCVWMAAKCEHNDWLNNQEENSKSDFVAGKYFRQLKAGFADTKYYKEVLAECGYFCTYTTGKQDCIRNR